MMTSPQRGLEEQLKEAGIMLSKPPTPVEELLDLLRHVEDLLSGVEQSPSESIQEAISSITVSVVSDVLLRHSDVDVKVAVASCITEITRITAPEAPYDDERMKDIFQLIVSAFEGLSDKSSRSYTRRIVILETVAQVRSCVVMLDLECDDLIVEMFKTFLANIRDYHPESVFTAMETIMVLVLEESEDISSELLTPLLACLKKGKPEVLPVAVKLAERVFENCAAILKPYLSEAIKSLEDYNEVVAAVCGGPSSNIDADEIISGPLNSVMGNGVSDNGKVIAREKGQDNQSADKLASESEDDESETQKPLKVGSKVERADSITARKPNSSMNASESSNTSDKEKDSDEPSDAKLRRSRAPLTKKDKKPSMVMDTSKIENKGPGTSEKKQMKQLGKRRAESSNTVDDSLVGKSVESKKRSKTKPALENDNLKKTLLTKTSSKLSKESRSPEDNPGMSSKRELASSQQKATEKSLVGTRVKVWWPDDEMFYKGFIHSYDSATKKHKVVYDDGEDEILLLKKERWEIIDDDITSSEEQADETTRGKAKTNPKSLVKPGKSDVDKNSPKLSPKGKSKLFSPKTSSKSMQDSAKTSSKSKQDSAKTSSKSKQDSAKTSSKSKQDSAKTSSKSKQDSAKTSSKSKQDSVKTSSKSKQDSAKTSSKSKQDGGKTSGKSKQDGGKTSGKSKPKDHEAGDDDNAGKIRNKEKVADVAKTSGGKVKSSKEIEGITKKRRRVG